MARATNTQHVCRLGRGTRRAGPLLVLLAVTISSALSCRSGVQEVAPEAPPGPAPVVELAGQAVARRVADAFDMPWGPGAEGRPGDFLLENAFVQFIIAARDRTEGFAPAGNVLDAAVQGGEDRIRLFAPLIVHGTARRPVVTDVTIGDPGGLGKTASVVATGYLLGEPAVKVRTTYRLPADESALGIETAVENTTDGALQQVQVRDALYHGRTIRYSPGAGLFPTGESAPAQWMAAVWGGYVWGVVGDDANPFMARHEAGRSVLEHAAADVPAGESRVWHRRLLAGLGGPDLVWRAAYPVRETELSHLELDLVDGRSQAAAGEAAVELTTAGGASPVVVLAGRDGRAALELPGGAYSLSVAAPGRPRFGPVQISVLKGARHVLTLPLEPASEVTATAQTWREGRPAAACAVIRAWAGAPERGPAFPCEPWGAVGAFDGSAPLSLRPALPVVAALTECQVLAFRGPLYSVAFPKMALTPGRAVPFGAILEQAVAPGEYVAADLRQHTAGSPDCALTCRERALLNACSGVALAVASDAEEAAPCDVSVAAGASVVVPGRRIEVPGVGAFSFYGGPADDYADGALKSALVGNASGEDVLTAIRQLFPQAVVQVDAPLDENVGFVALNDRLPRARFDALEVLSGADVAGARRLLPLWFAALNADRRIFVTGGSGSVGLAGPQAGLALTFVRCPRAEDGRVTAEEAEAALMRLPAEPDAFVTNGPFIEARLNGLPIGSTQTVTDGRARLELRVWAAPWVDASWARVYRNGEMVAEFPILPSTAPLRADRTYDLAVSRDCWFAVQVEGDRPLTPVYGLREAPTPWAVTNPFWVDGDGDGLVRLVWPAGT